MSEVVRIGVSVEGPLLDRFDRLLEDRGITNRSEALRDLIREHLVDAEVADEVEAIGTLTMVFDHRRRALASGLTSVQHHHAGHVISSMHVHVDEAHCLEVIAMRGTVGEMRRLADRLAGSKGVLYGKLVLTSVDALTGSSSPRGREHKARGHTHD